MRRLDVRIPTPDGHSNGTLHLPDEEGPWPGVLVFPDAGGVRETLSQTGDRLTSMGYVALIPDIYYQLLDRAHGRRSRPHHRVLSHPPRIRHARQPGLRPGSGRPALGSTPRALPRPPRTLVISRMMDANAPGWAP
jgi:hypothetical protein